MVVARQPLGPDNAWARPRLGVGQVAHRGPSMSYYLPYITARDEDNWQRYTIGLGDKSLAAARVRIEDEATSWWSFKVAHGPRAFQDPLARFTHSFSKERRTVPSYASSTLPEDGHSPMTVRCPKHPQSHPEYLRDLADATGSAFKPLVLVAVSAGWGAPTVVEGLLVLPRAQAQAVVAQMESEIMGHTILWQRPWHFPRCHPLDSLRPIWHLRCNQIH